MQKKRIYIGRRILWSLFCVAALCMGCSLQSAGAAQEEPATENVLELSVSAQPVGTESVTDVNGKIWAKEMELYLTAKSTGGKISKVSPFWVGKEVGAGQYMELTSYVQTVYAEDEMTAVGVLGAPGNGTYRVLCMDEMGQTLEQTILVEQVDVTLPYIKEIRLTPEVWMDGMAEVTVLAQDGVDEESRTGCGLAKEAYSWDGGITWTAENVKKIQEEGICEVLVRDALGNTVSGSIQAKKVVPEGMEEIEEVVKANRPEKMAEVVAKEITNPEPSVNFEKKEEEITKEEITKPEVEIVSEKATIVREKEKEISKGEMSTKEGIVAEETKEVSEQKEVSKEEKRLEKVEKEKRVLQKKENSTKVYRAVAAAMIGVPVFLTLICLFGLYLQHKKYMTVELFLLEEHHKRKKLGEIMITQKEEKYVLLLSPELLFEGVGSDYLIRFDFWFARRWKGEKIYISYLEVSFEETIKREISFSI